MTDWEGLGATRLFVAAALREGAEEVRRRGWARGRFRDEDTGAVDAVQAIGEAVGLDLHAASKRGARLDAGRAVLLGACLQAACAHLGCQYLSKWNDDDGRTQGDVTTALEGAADRLARPEGT